MLVNKKKLLAYSWQAPGFVLSREYLLLQDIPKSIQYICNTYVVIGYKRHYEYLDLITGAMTRLFDVEKEHKMVALQVTVTTLLLLLFYYFCYFIDLFIITCISILVFHLCIHLSIYLYIHTTTLLYHFYLFNNTATS